MELTFGTGQIYTSQKLKKYPGLAQVFHKTFGYTNVGNYARFTVFKKLIKEVGINPNAKVLDLGTGYGEYALSLAQALPESEIHALDIDLDRVKTVNQAIESLELSNVRTHTKPIAELSHSKFDVIFTVDVFEHIDPQEMPFLECYERLKPGGLLMVKIPNKHQKTIFPERHFEDHHHWLEEEHIGQVYDLNGLAQRFKAEGFEIIHASYSDGWLSRFAWELAYLGKKVGLITQLLTLPVAKFFIHLDRLIHHNNWGNAIQVIGQKPLS